MKLLHIFVLLLSLVVFSCTKAKIENINPNSPHNHTPLEVNEGLIVGKWQLTDIGTVTASCPDPVCPMYKTEVIPWTQTTRNEILNFTKTGEFTKEADTDGLCKGIFRINDNQLFINSSCWTQGDIRSLTQAVLILGIENQKTRYKYVKL